MKVILDSNARAIFSELLSAQGVTFVSVDQPDDIAIVLDRGEILHLFMVAGPDDVDDVIGKVLEKKLDTIIFYCVESE